MDPSRLRILADILVRNIDADDRLPVSCLSEDTINQLSTQTSLQDIVTAIQNSENPDPAKIHGIVVWAEGLLRNPHGILQASTTGNAAGIIQDWAVTALAPPKIFAPKSHFDSNRASSPKAIETSRWKLMAVAGLRLLSHLRFRVLTLYEDSVVDMAASLGSFTDSRDPWTRPEAFETANALLVDLLRRDQLADPKFLSKLLASLLQDRVKPSFAQTRSSAITEQGRKANYRLPSAVDVGDSEVDRKPWKFRDIHILTVFRWILGILDETTVQEHWPLVIPPLLAILDDEAVDNKIRGCELLVALLNIIPSSLLQHTGLGEVFQDALMPCLSYLPSLTLEDQSIRLLDTVYPTLFLLLRVRYPGPESTAEKITVLDRIVRVGILNGFGYAGEHVKIATVLMKRIPDLVNEMGILSAKHLKDLLPLIGGVLSAPFGPAHPPLLLAAAVALQAVILNDWPRIDCYQAEILKGLALCWYTINESICESCELDSVKTVVRQDINLLRECVRANVVDSLGMDVLLHDNHQLGGLL